MELNLEEEKSALARYELLKYECSQSHELFDQQRKLVHALEQLEQAREALDAIRLHPTVCNSFRGRQIVELADKALKQQEVGNE